MPSRFSWPSVWHQGFMGSYAAMAPAAAPSIRHSASSMHKSFFDIRVSSPFFLTSTHQWVHLLTH